MSGNNGRGYDGQESTLPTSQESCDSTQVCHTTSACGWQIVGASVPGAIHERSGAPNQDALSWWSAEGEKPRAVLCVADGHGGSEYTRSHIGSRRAVKEAKKLLMKEVMPRILDGDGLRDLAQLKRQLSEQLPKLLVSRWQASVSEHAAGNPITEDEIPHANGGEAGEPRATKPSSPVERRYGATLLAVLLTPELHLYIQLGDGDVLTVTADGEVVRPPFGIDSHLFANYTTSLCSKEAWRFVRIHFQPIVDSPPEFIMLATDGYANSFADDADFEQVARDLYSAIKQDGLAAVAGRLPDWLEATSKGGSGDDISVVMAANLSRPK